MLMVQRHFITVSWPVTTAFVDAAAKYGEGRDGWRGLMGQEIASTVRGLEEARLGVIQGSRASLGALLVPSQSGLLALRNQGRKVLTQTLRQHLSEHCEALALPRRWRLLRQMPLNSQGKLPPQYPGVWV